MHSVFYQKVDENMKVAQKRNAVQEGMFYFRKDIYKGERIQVRFQCFETWSGSVLAKCLNRLMLKLLLCPPIGCNPALDSSSSAAQNGLDSEGDNEYTLMSIDTIINGKVLIKDAV